MNVVNPLTHRKIKVGGPTFKKIYGHVAFSQEDAALLARLGYNTSGPPEFQPKARPGDPAKHRAVPAPRSNPGPCKQICEPDRVCNPATKRCNKIPGSRRARVDAATPSRPAVPVAPRGPAAPVAPPRRFQLGLAEVEVETNRTTLRFTEKGPRYEVEYPVVKAPYRRIPTQAGPSCYLHAALNAMLQQTRFVTDLLAHLSEAIARSPFARRPGESVKDANARRFGDQALDVTISRSFTPTAAGMKVVADKARRSPELLKWSRYVVLANLIRRSCDEAAFPRTDPEGPWRRGESRHEVSMALVALNAPLDLDSAADALYDSLAGVGLGNKGGYTVCMLASILHDCGLQVLYSRAFMFARIPSTGRSLLYAGATGQDTPQFSLNFPVFRERPFFPQDPDFSRYRCASGAMSVHVTQARASTGHVVCFVQDARGHIVALDSVGYTGPLAERMVDLAMLLSRGDPAVLVLQALPMYTTVTPSWPLSDPPDEHRARGCI